MKCHVARLWDSTNPNMQDQLMSLDLLLIDGQGSTIECSIRKEDAPRMRELIKEGQIYIFANFIVGTPRNSFRVCRNESMLCIGTWTIIKEVCDMKDNIPLNYFDLVDVETMERRLYKDVYLTDVIGNLKSVGKTKKNMQMADLLKDISLTLWGSIAQKFDEDHVPNDGNKDSLIVVICSTTVRSFRGETTLSSTSATKIYINLDIPQVHDFKSRMLYLYEKTIYEDLEEDLVNKVAASEIMKKTIDDLSLLTRNLDMGKKFQCEATIINIDPSKGWWYNTCIKCKAGVTNYKGMLACISCGPNDNIPIPWYKIALTVSDGTKEAKFLMFGKHVERLINMPATLLAEMPGADRKIIPEALKILYGKKLHFVVSISNREEDPFQLSFTVSKVSEINEGNTVEHAGNEKLSGDVAFEDIQIGTQSRKRMRISAMLEEEKLKKPADKK